LYYSFVVIVLVFHHKTGKTVKTSLLVDVGSQPACRLEASKLAGGEATRLGASLGSSIVLYVLIVL